MDHRLAGRQQLLAGDVQAEAVDADITRHGQHPAVHLAIELGAEFAPETVEAIVLDDLAADPICRPPAPGSDQQCHLGLRNGAQQPLGERGAEEPGRAGNGDAPPPEGFTEHCDCLPSGK